MNDERALKPVEQIRGALEKMGPQFKMALPAHIPVEKFNRVAQTAISNNPALLSADRTSLFAACMKSAQDGLLPDGREAALVPYGTTVQYQPMIGGILKKLRNSGELLTITANIIYANDKFSYKVVENKELLNHEPVIYGDKGDPVAAYAIATTKANGVYIEIMDTVQILAVKKVSKGASRGPWAGDFEEEMWKKTVIRRLAKRLPSSTDIDQVFDHDNENYEIEKPTKDVSNNSTSRLEAAISQSEASQVVDTSSETPI